MNKDDFNSWLAERTQTQSKLLMGAIVAMCGIGLLGFLIQGGLLYAIFSAAYSRVAAIVVLLGLFGGMGYFTWLTGPKTLKDEVHEVELVDGTVRIPIAPSLSNAWTYAMGSRDSALSILERIFAFLMLVPRMFWTAWYLTKRVHDVRAINVRECGAILRFVLKKAERVDATEIAEKRPKTNLPETLRQLSLLDGVVFLVRGKLGLTLANRFKDDVEEGVAGRKKPSSRKSGQQSADDRSADERLFEDD
ncbi:MAG: hypothetical protein NXI04_05650 [Planctomycetaceae bacterium]|nr:hypothetical protein [Planctomycetaceae bacterium]